MRKHTKSLGPCPSGQHFKRQTSGHTPYKPEVRERGIELAEQHAGAKAMFDFIFIGNKMRNVLLWHQSERQIAGFS